VLEVLIKDQIRGDADIAGMLASYQGKPAFFFQKAPSDTDRDWKNPCYPRMDFSVSNRYDPERKTSGTLEINIWCSTECRHMPEDIEARVVELVSGTFYTGGHGTTCAVWNRSDAFHFEGQNASDNTEPEVFGITALFDLMEFPEQQTTAPDPIQGLNLWTRKHFSGANIINLDSTPPVWKPTDLNPEIYWRFEGMDSDDRQSYAATWYTGNFAAHLIAETVTERNRWTKALIERIQHDGEILLADGSPMFIKRVTVRHGADPLREGQLLITGLYGVLRGEYAQAPLNNANFTNINMEVRTDGKVNQHCG
jgi:hypothetical protein